MIIINNSSKKTSAAKYLEYVAVLNQTGTTAPIATILNATDENFFTGISFEYVNTGSYKIVFANAVDFSKLIFFIGSVNAQTDFAVATMVKDNNYIRVTTHDNNTGAQNGRLQNTSIYIALRI